jgi:hypothetical protein
MLPLGRLKGIELYLSLSLSYLIYYEIENSI